MGSIKAAVFFHWLLIMLLWHINCHGINISITWNLHLLFMSSALVACLFLSCALIPPSSSSSSGLRLRLQFDRIKSFYWQLEVESTKLFLQNRIRVLCMVCSCDWASTESRSAAPSQQLRFLCSAAALLFYLPQRQTHVYSWLLTKCCQNQHLCRPNETHVSQTEGLFLPRPQITCFQKKTFAWK